MVVAVRTAGGMVFTAGELLFTSKRRGVVLQYWNLVQEYSVLWNEFNAKYLMAIYMAFEVDQVKALNSEPLPA